MLVSLEGDEAVGKTTFAYSAPLPIVGFGFDMGIERAISGSQHALFDDISVELVPYDRSKVEPDQRTADITVYELPRPIQLDTSRVTGAKELWSYFLIRIGDAFNDPKVRTIVVDTMTLCRRIKADAHLQTLQEDDEKAGKAVVRKQLIQIEYGTVNDAVRDIWNAAPAMRKNFIGTHHLTDEYARTVGSNGQMESVPTGRRVLEGMTGTHKFPDVALLMQKKEGKPVATWLKNGYNLSMEGTKMEAPTWDSVVSLLEMASGDRLQLEHRGVTV